MPVIAPDRNAMLRAGLRPVLAASVVRTLARTETCMPMYPAAPDSTAPITNPIATQYPSVIKSTTVTTSPTMPMVVYCRFR